MDLSTLRPSLQSSFSTLAFELAEVAVAGTHENPLNEGNIVRNSGSRSSVDEEQPVESLESSATPQRNVSSLAPTDGGFHAWSFVSTASKTKPRCPFAY